MGFKNRFVTAVKAFSARKAVRQAIVKNFWQSIFSSDALGKSQPTDFTKQVKEYKSWVYACCSLIAQVSASVPLKLYAKEGIDKEGKRKHREIIEHPFLDMWTNVNEWQNNHEMLELLSTFLGLTGNAYLYLVNNRLGVPAEMWVLPSQRVNIVPGDKFISGYLYTREDGEIISFTPQEIVHFKYPNPLDMFYGYSTTFAASRPIDHANNMDEYESALFRNMGRPDIGIIPEGELGEEEFRRLKEQWDEKHSGIENAGRAIILEGIKDVKTWATTVSPREIAFLKGRSVVKEEIYSMFHIPLTFADPIHASRANMDNDDMRLAKYAIKPHLIRIQEKINEQILPRYDPKLFCKFDIDSIIPLNKELRIREREVNIRAGYSTRDEERAIDGRSPLPNGVGSVIYVPVNTVAVKTLNDAPIAKSSGSSAQVNGAAGERAPSKGEEPSLGDDKEAGGEGGGDTKSPPKKKQDAPDKKRKRPKKAKKALKVIIARVLEDEVASIVKKAQALK